jgi:hypothetical protein
MIKPEPVAPCLIGLGPGRRRGDLSVRVRHRRHPSDRARTRREGAQSDIHRAELAQALEGASALREASQDLCGPLDPRRLNVDAREPSGITKSVARDTCGCTAATETALCNASAARPPGTGHANVRRPTRETCGRGMGGPPPPHHSKDVELDTHAGDGLDRRTA